MIGRAACGGIARFGDESCPNGHTSRSGGRRYSRAMGVRVSLIAVLLVLAAGTFPANAAQRGVLERNCQFSPSLIFINPGDTVTWTYNEDASSPCAGQNHRVRSYGSSPQSFDSSPGCTKRRRAFGSSCMNDPPFGQPTFSVTLTRPGTYTYYCPIHATISFDGTCSGMCGQIVINAPPTPPPSATASATVSARPSSSRSASPSASASAPASVSPSPSPSVLAAGSNGAGGVRRGIIAVAAIAVLASLGALVWRLFLAER